MSTIRKRTWTTRTGNPGEGWILTYNDDEGKRRTRMFGMKKEAETARAEIMAELVTGIHTPDAYAPTVAQATKAWLKNAEARGFEATTLAGYRQRSRDHIIPHLGQIKLSRLKPPEVQIFLDQRLEAGTSMALVRMVRTDLVMLLNYAEARGQVGRNAARPTKLPTATKRKARVAIPSVAQIRLLSKWLNTTHNDAKLARLARRAKPLLTLAWSAGLRASELRGLAWSNLDLPGARVEINQRADRFGIIGPCKSEAAYRVIPLPDACVTTLREWQLAATPNPDGLVFPNQAGRPQALNNLRRRLVLPVLTAAGLVVPAPTKADPAAIKLAIDMPLHGMRHFAASAWIRQHCDMKQLQAWLGHGDIQMTYNTYGHLLERDPAQEAAFMARVEAYVLGDAPAD